jgi:MarR family transcriptional regulator, transcriptional regulator for hemolysin
MSGLERVQRDGDSLRGALPHTYSHFSEEPHALKRVELISTLIIWTLMETLPFEIGETAHALRRSFDRRAATLGVTRAQWKVLFRLSRTPGLRQVELADQLDVEPITLVERTADPADRRAWRLQVTSKAAPLIEKLRKLAGVLVDEAFDGLSPQDLEFVREKLARVRENLACSAGAKNAVGA